MRTILADALTISVRDNFAAALIISGLVVLAWMLIRKFKRRRSFPKGFHRTSLELPYRIGPNTSTLYMTYIV